MNGLSMNSGEPLPGGNMSVVWVGDTVRREQGRGLPRSTACQHLRSQDHLFPVPLGMDKDSREVLTYLPGTVGEWPLAGPQQNDAVLVQAATMRALHDDATVDVAAGLAHRLASAGATTRWR